ncbi:hypothetical protein [Pyxidicoccus xibeiensis]|uniref:hypothetical protein n=1 Tax=Pyxidicoccus xibeiensis TaxID=2906759 RepID=UPI0020A74634|nr:hypothetical protein [Pyxidicoccus xibeiensis]MCP3144789.1 hypothetical protein [Pyxidicoccus xibeiensis]
MEGVSRMETQGLEGHRRILGILFIVMNALTLLAAVAVVGVMLFASTLGGPDMPQESRTVMLVGTLGMGGCLLLVGLPGIITGVGLLKRRRWARMAALVLGIISLPSAPLGTAVGIYALWFYMQQGSDQVFE